MLNGIPFFGAAKNSIPFSRLKPITKKDPESKLSESLKIIIFNRRSKNYSMIVATLPDPTVRPPSRYQTGVLRCANGDFSCDLCGKIRIFRCVRVVLGDFVIMVLSSPLNNTMIHNLCNAFCALYNFFFSPFFLVFIFFYKFFHCCILRFWVSCHF